MSFIKIISMDFYLEVRPEFLTISEMAIKILLPFCTAYLLKSGILSNDSYKNQNISQI